MNPNNRRVVAMIVSGPFAEQQKLKSFNTGEARSPERLVVLSMNLIRYLTRTSGFLHVNSNERERYMDFDPAAFAYQVWLDLLSYCPITCYSRLNKRWKIGEFLHFIAAALEEQLRWEQLLAPALFEDKHAIESVFACNRNKSLLSQ
jgi:hypothetical protein